MLLLLAAAQAWSPRCSTEPLGDPYVEVALSADPHHAIIAEQIATRGLLGSAWILTDPAAGCEAVPVALPAHVSLHPGARLVERPSGDAVHILGWTGVDFALQASLPTPQPSWSNPSAEVGFAGDLATVSSYDHLTFQRQTLLVPLRADDPRPPLLLPRALQLTTTTWHESTRRVFGFGTRPADGTRFTVFGRLTDTGLRREPRLDTSDRDLLSFDGRRALLRSNSGRPTVLSIAVYDDHAWREEAELPLDLGPDIPSDEFVGAWLDGNVLVAGVGEYDGPSGGVGLWRRGPAGWTLTEVWEAPVVEVLRQGADVLVATKDPGQHYGETDGRPDIPPSPARLHLLSIAVVDSDGDGSPSPDDCDDGDAAAQVPAAETCNGVDDDCDGSVDEGCLSFDTTDTATVATPDPELPEANTADAGCACHGAARVTPPSAVAALLLLRAMRRSRR